MAISSLFKDRLSDQKRLKRENFASWSNLTIADRARQLCAIAPDTVTHVDADIYLTVNQALQQAESLAQSLWQQDFREGDVFTKNFINNTITRFPSNGERSFDKYNYGTKTAISYSANKNDVFNFGFFIGKKFQARRADIIYNNSTSNLSTDALLSQNAYFNSNVQTKEGTFTLKFPCSSETATVVVFFTFTDTPASGIPVC